ncbi:MAG: 1-acyl-sn-glycerol-3-phosphate acyltransferase [Deltaproteobacteria bacterium]|nr:1-acyl-sn-glycerol-3-phosphate acyltransferase [Deltaproteobacteria bacterium]
MTDLKQEYFGFRNTVSVFARFFAETFKYSALEFFSTGESHELMQKWSKKTLDILGVNLTIKGLENISYDKPQIFCANHQSNVDAFIMNVAVPVKFYWIYKHTLNFVPLAGQFLLRNGHIPINRGNRTKAIESIRQAGELVKLGKNVVIFPEGTRSGKAQMNPFKKGAFWLARESGVPIIPVSIENSWKLMKKHSMKLASSPVSVTFHPPIETGNMEVDELLATVQYSIGQGLEGYNS